MQEEKMRNKNRFVKRVERHKKEGGGGSVWCMFCINGVLFLPAK